MLFPKFKTNFPFYLLSLLIPVIIYSVKGEWFWIGVLFAACVAGFLVTEAIWLLVWRKR